MVFGTDRARAWSVDVLRRGGTADWDGPFAAVRRKIAHLAAACLHDAGQPSLVLHCGFKSGKARNELGRMDGKRCLDTGKVLVTSKTVTDAPQYKLYNLTGVIHTYDMPARLCLSETAISASLATST